MTHQELQEIVRRNEATQAERALRRAAQLELVESAMSKLTVEEFAAIQADAINRAMQRAFS